jgi:hypothetical protein
MASETEEVFLFVAIGVTLVLPDFAVCYTVLISIVGLTVASVASRSVFLISRRLSEVPTSLGVWFR